MELHFFFNLFGQIIFIYSNICVCLPRHLQEIANKSLYRRPTIYRSVRDVSETETDNPSDEKRKVANFKFHLKLMENNDNKKEVEESMNNPLNDEDYNRADLLSANDMVSNDANDGCLVDPHFLEGDITLLKRKSLKDAIKVTTKVWPKRRIPYVIKKTFTERSRAVIAYAIRDINKNTCVDLTPAKSKDLLDSYVYIFPGDICYSNNVGFKPSINNESARVDMSVGKDCHRVRVVQHLLMHILGFWHEHNRPDRDKYIRIKWKYVKFGKKHYLKRNKKNDGQNLSYPYDYESIMHYSEDMFSRGKEATIVPKGKGVIFRLPAVSVLDIEKINNLYKCQKDWVRKKGLNQDDFEVDKGTRYKNYPGKINKDSSELQTRKDVEEGMKNPLDETDFERADKLTVEYMVPIKNSDTCLNDPKLLEGDIKQTKLNATKTSPKDKEKPTLVRNAVSDSGKIWPRKRLPYVIKNNFTENARAVIAKAIQDMRDKTCIKITPATSSDLFREYLYIFPGEGCYASNVGFIPSEKMKGARVEISVGKNCQRVGVVQHLLMHILGFWHEQNRPDRDDFVKINFDNIKPDKKEFFKKNTEKESTHLDLPYDYSSIMHYSANMFSKGKEPTIVPMEKGVEIGQRIGLSELDVKKLNKLYQCP